MSADNVYDKYVTEKIELSNTSAYFRPVTISVYFCLMDQGNDMYLCYPYFTPADVSAMLGIDIKKVYNWFDHKTSIPELSIKFKTNGKRYIGFDSLTNGMLKRTTTHASEKYITYTVDNVMTDILALKAAMFKKMPTTWIIARHLKTDDSDDNDNGPPLIVLDDSDEKDDDNDPQAPLFADIRLSKLEIEDIAAQVSRSIKPAIERLADDITKEAMMKRYLVSEEYQLAKQKKQNEWFAQWIVKNKTKCLDEYKNALKAEAMQEIESYVFKEKERRMAMLENELESTKRAREEDINDAMETYRCNMELEVAKEITNKKIRIAPVVDNTQLDWSKCEELAEQYMK